ncbi:MAG: hypothetical protein ACREMF_06645 [Gemmatimonadales bacterium]
MVARSVTVALGLLAGLARLGTAQDVQPFSESADTRYFDFWEGTWHQVVGGAIDTTRTIFRVRRDVHPAAFVEEWRMVIGPTRMRATALRAWDKTAGRWMYTWVSDNGLYQVWEGRKVGEHWFIYREFDIQGDRYLSRQAWIPDGADRLIRISERSDDGGKTWTLRFREVYQRAAP